MNGAWRAAGLRSRGFVSEVTYQQQHEAVLALRQQLEGLEQRFAEARQSLSAARLMLAELAATAQAAEQRDRSSLQGLDRAAAEAEAAAHPGPRANSTKPSNT